MAISDYYLCDVCKNKAFYDSDVDWDTCWSTRGKGSLLVICGKCSEEGYFLQIANSKDCEGV